jgi:hypothetical protein
VWEGRRLGSYFNLGLGLMSNVAFYECVKDEKSGMREGRRVRKKQGMLNNLKVTNTIRSKICIYKIVDIYCTSSD